MADKNLNDGANHTKLCRLLIEVGTEALRKRFDAFYSSSTLPTFLKKYRTLLFRLKCKVINENQWDLLFPTSGNPDSKNFDISLLLVLLRTICNLKPPAAGWSTTPPDTDRSLEANIIRMQQYRNEIYAHAANSEVTDDEFEHTWSKISQSLIELEVSKAEIEQLRDSPLGPDAESYFEVLKDWKLQDHEMQKVLDEVKISTRKVLKTTHETKESMPENTRKLQESIHDNTREIKESIAEEGAKKEIIHEKEAESFGRQYKNLLLKLCKFNFDGDVEELVKLSNSGTRNWLFKVNDWFLEKRSKVLVLIATSNVCKSVLAAKITEKCKAYGQLAACHFCKFNNSNYSKPINMIQSLASQICDSVKGFEENLLKQLTRMDKVKTLQDAFQVYLKDPLQYMQQMKPMLVVIDSLEECRWNEKTDLLEILAKEFSKLPAWLKVLVTNRPKINVKEKFSSLDSIEILSTDENKEEENLTLHLSARFYKQNISKLKTPINGTYDYARHPRKRGANITKEDVWELCPKTLNEAYCTYFERFETKLPEISRKYVIRRLLNLVTVAYQPIPLSLFTEGLELAPNLKELKQIIDDINETVTSLLCISSESVTVFHKSVVDWLLQKQHDYTVDLEEADKLLWEMIENKLNEARKNFETEKNGSSICSLTENKTMQYVLKHAFQHLFRAASYIVVRFEWLVDVFALHLMTTGKSFKSCMEAWRHFLRAADGNESNSAMKAIQQKVSWNYEHFSKFEVEPIYVQNFYNEAPKEIFSDKEKHIAKNILDNCRYFWCEKLGYLNLAAPINHVTASAFSPDGSHLVSCAVDGRICIWSINSLQAIKEVFSYCKSAIRCFWSESDEILIYHYAKDAEDAEDGLMLSRYTVQLAKKSDKKLAMKSDTLLAFSTQAFIFKCSTDSSIKVTRFTKTNQTTTCIPDLRCMLKFAVTRDGSSILATNKDHFEIWNVRGTTSTEYNLVKSEKFELDEDEYRKCDCIITEVLSCVISNNQNRGIISYLCSVMEKPCILVKDMDVKHPGQVGSSWLSYLTDENLGSSEMEEPCILVKDMDVEHPGQVGSSWLSYPTDENLRFELIKGNNDDVANYGDDDDNDDSDTFYVAQSYKRVTVYSSKCEGPLTHFEHNGDPDYYKESPLCRSGNMIALPQQSGGICLVTLHLPKTNWKNFGSRVAEFRWNM